VKTAHGIVSAILAELTRVLREDFGWDGYRLKFAQEKLLRVANHVRPTQTLTVVDDPDDDRIIERAVEAGSDFIVTNDKAILRIGEYGGIRMVRIAEFLNA
jgi:predicted nucleic acid-binding protein